MIPFIILIIVPIIIGAILCSILIPINVRNKKYTQFVLNHSVALKKLLEINARYKFLPVSEKALKNKYDNKDFYDEVSCKDYLIYNLVDIKKEVDKNIENALENRSRLKLYDKEYKDIRLGKYDADIGNLNIKKLNEIESRHFYFYSIRPIIDYKITVRLTRTNIVGDFQESKNGTFDIGDLLNLMERIDNKRGNFYLDQDIWDSICRVERAKLSNKMRFQILKRDGERCKICGSTKNLEIDHIYPISKGGKTTMDNLQTLCHNCNVKKGNSV